MPTGDISFFLFSPGAGAPCSHPWMAHWAELLKRLGAVRSFDYSYMVEGRRRPDPLPKLVATHRDALLQAKQELGGYPILIGKSMGSRIGCHVSLDEKVAAVICLGYPLCGGGDATNLRDKVLFKMTTPILFVQGTRDTLCPLDILEGVRSKMTAPNGLHIVQGGDHSLLVGKKQLKASRLSQDDVDRQILEAIRRFVAMHVG